MHRFYCKNINLSEEKIVLSQTTEIHHIKNVLRLKKGAKVSIFTESKEEAIVEITSLSDSQIEFNLIELLSNSDTSDVQLVLACALPKKGKFETIIEKATELGINEIFPLQTKRTEVVLKGDRLSKKRERFQTVAINAAKQSKRNTVPTIHPITNFEKCLTTLQDDTQLIIPSLNEKSLSLQKACDKIFPTNKIGCLIGPEGDFTEEEYTLAEKKGCIPVTLGPTTLKVETAAICTISYLRQVSF